MSIDIAKYPTLALVETPDDLRLLPKESLPKLCDELRQYLLNSVSRSSGHFASGLGTIELTVALHYVPRSGYQTASDRHNGVRPSVQSSPDRRQYARWNG